MKKFLLLLFGLLCTEACSPPDEHSPSPTVIPERNQTKSLENNASIPPKPENNRTAAPAPRPTTGLAGFLPGKQIDLKVANDAVKLAPQFDANGTWSNTLNREQHGPYSVREDGLVILNLPDKSRLVLIFNGIPINTNDEVSVIVEDMVLLSTVESIK